ncbi:hypothetical protein [uncultured Desulfobacter sp.]|nr:hypothetical protein [uncultured Desulfobacter sp.]
MDKQQANGSQPEDPMTFFSGLLIKSAQTVDHTIEDMVKNAFDNSLESFV